MESLTTATEALTLDKVPKVVVEKLPYKTYREYFEDSYRVSRD